MLDVYMDYKMASAFINAADKTTKEKDLRKRNRLTKAELFIRQSCNLKLDANIKKFNSNIYTFFTQGVGENGTVVSKEFIEDEITENRWAVALLDKVNPLISNTSKSNLTISKEQLWESLFSLMFNSPEQVTAFQIIPNDLQNGRNVSSKLNTFYGWKTFKKHNILPLTDAVIIDPYFLQPEEFKDSYYQYDVANYVEKSLGPMLELLYANSLDKPLTVNIFTRLPKNQKTTLLNPQELFDCLNLYAQKFIKPINLLIVVGRKLNLKYRVMYTNYFALNSELSFYQFQNEFVTGNEEARLIISPFAVDEVKTDLHNSMIRDLSKLYHLYFERNAQIYGQRKNLSPMLIQAHNQLNPTNQ